MNGYVLIINLKKNIDNDKNAKFGDFYSFVFNIFLSVTHINYIFYYCGWYL